jgi:hypothetical protein
MSLLGHVFTAPDGVRGFDTASTVTPSAAAALYKHGFRFAVRYVRRDKPHASALSAKESKYLLDAGLGIMPVQYVESDTAWKPTAAKGSRNGQIAAEEADKLDFLWGVTVWCDLEGVAVGTPAQSVIDYCNRWHSEVSRAGYVPGLYVGYRAGLTPILSLLGRVQSQCRQVPRGEGIANETEGTQAGRLPARSRSRFPDGQSERGCPRWPSNAARSRGLARAPVIAVAPLSAGR